MPTRRNLALGSCHGRGERPRGQSRGLEILRNEGRIGQAPRGDRQVLDQFLSFLLPVLASWSVWEVTFLLLLPVLAP